MAVDRSFPVETCAFLKPALEQTPPVFVANIITCVFDLLVVITASVSNALIVHVIRKNRNLHSPSNTLLGCLAVTDLLVGSLVAPLNILTVCGEMVTNRDIYCVAGVISSFIGWLSMGLTFLTLAVISVKRYLAIRNVTMMTTKRVLKVMAFLWLNLFALITLRFWDTKEVFFRPVLVGFSVLCIVIIVFCYGNIFVLCRRYRLEIHGNMSVLMNKRENKASISVRTMNLQTSARNVFMARHKKASLTMFYILLFFFLCYLPSIAYQITAATIGTSENNQTMRVAYRFSFSIAMVNSALNPVLYCLRIADLRKAVTKVINKAAKRPVRRLESIT